jgi:hypothetical protein
MVGEYVQVDGGEEVGRGAGGGSDQRNVIAILGGWKST